MAVNGFDKLGFDLFYKLEVKNDQNTVLAGKAKTDFAYLKERAGIENKEMLKLALLERCAKLEFKLLSRDVEQFVFSPEDAKKVLLFIEYVRGW